MEDKYYYFALTYINTRGEITNTSIIAKDDSEALDIAMNEDYYFSSRGLEIDLEYEVTDEKEIKENYYG